MRSHQRLKKGKKNRGECLLLWTSLFLSRQMLIRVFLSFHFSLYLHCLYLPESRLYFFFYYYYYYFVREIILALERFQLIFPMVFHGGKGEICHRIIYFSQMEKIFLDGSKKKHSSH